MLVYICAEASVTELNKILHVGDNLCHCFADNTISASDDQLQSEVIGAGVTAAIIAVLLVIIAAVIARIAYVKW